MTAQSSSRLPRYRRAAKPPTMLLTDRDEQIVEWVYKLRFATAEQIQKLLFTPTTTSSCRHRLTLLYHNRYLDRRLIPLRSSFGANRAVYCLDRRGAELLAFRNKTGHALHWRPADNDRELYFLEHTIGINDFRIRASLAAKAHHLILTWTDERELRSSALKQVVSDPKRPGSKLAVVPDGYFNLTGKDTDQSFALELDRSTVEERPFKEKIRALGEWKVTGAYKRAFNSESLRVLFVVADITRDRHRLARVKAWTEREGGKSLFWFARSSDLTPDNILTGAVWTVAGREGRFALLQS